MNGLYTIPMLMTALGRSRKSIEKWAERGYLETKRWHGQWRLFDLEEARAVAAACEARKAAPTGRGRRAVPTGKPLPAGAPTLTRPGSEERIAVYAARVERNEAVFHERDVTLATWEG